MIFVTLGTQKFQFNRLLELIDLLIEENKINEPVFAQVGNSTYVPKNYEWECFLGKKQFENKVKECDVLITHSGVATIIKGLENKRKVIVVPRLSKYGEHVDDHQVQIAEAFSELNFVIMCSEDDDLDQLIVDAKEHRFENYVSQRKKMISTINDFIDRLK